MNIKRCNCLVLKFQYFIFLQCTVIEIIYLKSSVARRIIDPPEGHRHYMFAHTNVTFAHAESPAWDPDSNTLYWVDVLNQNVHALHYNTRKHRVKHIEYGEVNVVVPVANSSRLLVGVRSEVFLLDWRGRGDSALRLVAALDVGCPDNVVNEGKADALGRLWAGTKGPHTTGDEVLPDHGALYVLEPLRAPEVRLKPVTISNGMTWALNQSLLYYTDSATRRIDAFQFHMSTGTISGRRKIIDLREKGYSTAVPDGITIDKDGMLWVALMFGGSVLQINPDNGNILETIKLPVSRISSVAWAGPNLRHLVVTTSRRNMAAGELAKEPLAGSLFFIYNLKTSGVPTHKVVFENADQY